MAELWWQIINAEIQGWARLNLSLESFSVPCWADICLDSFLVYVFFLAPATLSAL